MGEGSALFHVDRGRRTVHAKESCVPVAFQYYEEEKREGDVFVFMGEGMRGGYTWRATWCHLEVVGTPEEQ